MQTTILNGKDTKNTLSNKVKSILHKQGLSKVFNFTDFLFFKFQTKGAFNQAQAIADLFISEYRTDSDFNDYIF